MIAGKIEPRDGKGAESPYFSRKIIRKPEGFRKSPKGDVRFPSPAPGKNFGILPEFFL